MAYWFNDQGKYTSTKQNQYMMDSDNDKNDLPTSSSAGVPQDTDTTVHLPCAKGSLSFSIASGKIFMLNSSDQWVKIGG